AGGCEEIWKRVNRLSHLLQIDVCVNKRNVFDCVSEKALERGIGTHLLSPACEGMTKIVPTKTSMSESCPFKRLLEACVKCRKFDAQDEIKRSCRISAL